MEKQPRLKKYKFATWSINGGDRDYFTLRFYSKKEAIEYAKEWQKQNPDRTLQVYLGY